MYGRIEDTLKFWKSALHAFLYGPIKEKNALNAYKHFASHYLQYSHYLAINISYKIFMAGHYHYNSLSTEYEAVITKNSIAITLGMHFTGDAIKPIRQAIHAISNICNILFNSITYLERIYAIFIFSHLEIHTYIDPTLSILFIDLDPKLEL